MCAVVVWARARVLLHVEMVQQPSSKLTPWYSRRAVSYVLAAAAVERRGRHYYYCPIYVPPPYNVAMK